MTIPTKVCDPDTGMFIIFWGVADPRVLMKELLHRKEQLKDAVPLTGRKSCAN